MLLAGAQRDLADPFAEKRRSWRLYTLLAIVLLLAVAWTTGRLDGPLSSLSHRLTSAWVLHGQPSPAAAVPTTKLPEEKK